MCQVYKVHVSLTLHVSLHLDAVQWQTPHLIPVLVRRMLLLVCELVM